MTEPTRVDAPHYQDWIAHFRANDDVHAAADAIGFGAPCPLGPGLRGALIESVRRFQLGESGDGEHLLGKARRAGDPEYLRAAELFVRDEQQHAALLARLLDHLGGPRLERHWSDAVFVRLRRLIGLRAELMILMIAEVIALSYYGSLATRAPDPVVRAVGARILADEVAHVRFHRARLRAGFAGSSAPTRLLAGLLWSTAAAGATVAMAADHRRLLRRLGYRPGRFVLDALTDFARVARAVLVGPVSDGPRR